MQSLFLVALFHLLMFLESEVRAFFHLLETHRRALQAGQLTVCRKDCRPLHFLHIVEFQVQAQAADSLPGSK